MLAFGRERIEMGAGGFPLFVRWVTWHCPAGGEHGNYSIAVPKLTLLFSIFAVHVPCLMLFRTKSTPIRVLCIFLLGAVNYGHRLSS